MNAKMNGLPISYFKFMKPRFLNSKIKSEGVMIYIYKIILGDAIAFFSL